MSFYFRSNKLGLEAMLEYFQSKQLKCNTTKYDNIINDVTIELLNIDDTEDN